MKELEKPRVSIIMSTYNEELEYIEKSINSIRNQTYRNLEIVLVNDNPSRKELDDFLLSFVQNDERIIYLKNEINRGLVYSLNKALQNVSGEYIARMDADDISEIDRIEKQYAFMIQYELDIVGCNITKIDEDGNPIGELIMPKTTEAIEKYSKWGNCVIHPTWFCKKRVYDVLKGYRDINSCEDYDFLLRAILSGFKLGNLQENKLFYRIRSNSISCTNNVDQQLISYYLKTLYKKGKSVDLNNLNEYIASSSYKKERDKLNRYAENKQILKNSPKNKKWLIAVGSVLFNKYFYKNIMESYRIRERESKNIV